MRQGDRHRRGWLRLACPHPSRQTSNPKGGASSHRGVISYRVIAGLLSRIKLQEPCYGKPRGRLSMVDFLLGFAFVAMILSPAIVAKMHRLRARKRDN